MIRKWICVLWIVLQIAASIPSTAAAPPPDKQTLKQKYHAFIESLDHKRIAGDYPKAVQKLDSTDPKAQIAAIKTLAATGEVEVIPWIVQFVDSEDRHVRVYAGLSLLNVVSSHELKRRDMSQPGRVVIKPPGPDDLDLKPMAWVILKMLRKPDDGNTHSYAANMIGYLGLNEFEDEVRVLLKSRHPAVTRAARNALEMLGVEQPDSANKVRQIPVVVTGRVEPVVVEAGSPIPLTVTITNGLAASIYHNSFSLEPRDWNAETINLQLVDIYRDQPFNLYLRRPKVRVPLNVSGRARFEIKPGKSLVVRTNAAKWELRDGWKPGRYQVTVRVDNLTVDEYSTISVLSDPVEFTVKQHLIPSGSR